MTMTFQHHGLWFAPVDGRTVFLDTEFTTLDKAAREVWEIGAIVRDPGRPDREVEWQIRPDLTGASPDSLRIGQYYRRNRMQGLRVGSGLAVIHPEHGEISAGYDFAEDPERRLTFADDIAAQLAPMLDGATLVGKVISADELALDRFLPRWGQALTVHYRLRCVETLALGFVHGMRAERATVEGRELDHKMLLDRIPPPPYDPKELDALCGVTPPPAGTTHRAIVDARWARDVWDAVTGYEHPMPATDAAR